MIKTKFALMAIALVLFSSILSAAPTIVTNPIFNANPAAVLTQNRITNVVFGNKITPTSNLLINQLGYFSTSAIPLTTFKNVGLWDVSTQQLIASATITSISQQVGNYRWEALSPITLISGHAYVIGSSELAGTNYFISFGSENRSGIILDSTMIRTGVVANSLVYPSNVVAGGVTLANAAAFAAPEPEAYLLLGSMLFIAVFSAKRPKFYKQIM